MKLSARTIALLAVSSLFLMAGVFYDATAIHTNQYWTTGNRTLYVGDWSSVDGGGGGGGGGHGSGPSDLASCTLAQPCATLQGAINKVPHHVKDQIDIVAAPGTYAGAYIEDISVNPFLNGGDAGAQFRVRGSTAQITMGGGDGGSNNVIVVSCTNISGSTLNNCVAAVGSADGGTPGWTTDELAGKLFAVTSGTGSPQKAMVTGNNANSFSYGTTLTPQPANGSVVQFQENVSHINVGVKFPVEPNGYASTADYGFVVSGTTTGLGSGTVVIKNFDFISTYGGVKGAANSSIDVLECSFGNTSYGITNTGAISGQNLPASRMFAKSCSFTVPGPFYAGGPLYAIGCYGILGGAVAGGVLGAGQQSNAGIVQLVYSRFVGNGASNTYGVLASSGTAATVTGVSINNYRLGLSASTGGRITAAYTDLSNCLTGAAIATGIGTAMDLEYVTGTANTVGISVDGCSALINSSTTVTGTTELSIDGVAGTYTALRAATPTALPTTASPKGGRIYQ
jgi:hypothetical protein